MMKSSFSLLLIYLVLFSTILADYDPKTEHEIFAIFAAKDYDHASKFYEKLSNQSLPPWQEAILLYNLGTIRLAQHRSEEALKLFQSISAPSLSPILLRHLKNNEGLAYLRQAINESSVIAKDNELKFYFLKRSLQLFQQAEQIDCQIQQFENAKQCMLPQDLKINLQLAQKLIQETKDQQQNQLQQILQSIQQDSQLTLEQKQLKELLVSYQLVLLEEAFGASDLQHLKDKMNLLPSSFKTKNDFILSEKSLQNSYEQLLRGQNRLNAQFFLIYSYSFLQNLSQIIEPSFNPKEVLTIALNKAKTGLQLNLLFQNQIFFDSFKNEGKAAFISIQNHTLDDAKAFIPSVLKLEVEQFRARSSDINFSRCQLTPWNEAIPLFEQGYLSAQDIQKNLTRSNSSPPLSAFLPSQEQVVILWEKVLQLLEQAPSPESASEQSDSSQTKPNTAPADIQETLRLIQEMENQDTPESSGAPQQEFHAW